MIAEKNFDFHIFFFGLFPRPFVSQLLMLHTKSWGEEGGKGCVNEASDSPNN